MKFIKSFLLILLLLLFGFQAFQLIFKVIPQKRLNNVADTAKCIKLSENSYKSGEFQTIFNQYTEERMGFRPSLIRLRNQVDYSVFNYSDVPLVVIGKNRRLFGENYIRNSRGVVFNGENRIQLEIKRLKVIQDDLKKHNVDFFLIFAPGAATYYSELIPDRYKQRPSTNYHSYLNAISGSGLNFIDMNGWFLKMKGKTRYPLFPLNGAHWSTYGIYLAADSMFRYIRKLTNIDLPEFWYDKIVLSDKMKLQDDDIERMMNLWKPLKHDPMPYVHFRINSDGKKRPKVIAIGDSYWIGFSEYEIPQNVFSSDQYWNYFNEVIINNAQKGFVANLDLKKELYSQDIVIMIVTESNYPVFPFGFIEAYFEKCLPESPENQQIELEQSIEKIKNDKDWYAYVVKKAKEQGLTIDEALRRDAQYILSLNKKK
jgi:hypothetical protein